MAALKNVKHEAFVLGLVQGKPAYQAYAEAGYECTQRAAETSSSDLLKRPEVLARLLELAGKAEERTLKKLVLSKEWVVNRMGAAVEDAAADKAHGAVIRGIELLGRETGNFTEQKRVAIRSFHDMSAEEIEAFLAGTPAEAPQKKIGSGRASRTRPKARGSQPAG